MVGKKRTENIETHIVSEGKASKRVYGKQASDDIFPYDKTAVATL